MRGNSQPRPSGVRGYETPKAAHATSRVFALDSWESTGQHKHINASTSGITNDRSVKKSPTPNGENGAGPIARRGRRRLNTGYCIKAWSLTPFWSLGLGGALPESTAHRGGMVLVILR